MRSAGDGVKIDVHHRTTYRYARPVRLLPHRMMLRPRGSHDLGVLATTLACSPPADMTWTQDVFGNLIATGTFAEPAATLVITAEARVEQLAVEWPIFQIATGAHVYPFAYAAQDITDLGAMRENDPGEGDGSVAAWARGFVQAPATDTLSLLKAINTGILARVAYRVRDEEGTQTAQETLRIASGSCRDLAALFIAAVRHLGFGARAVSGYLLDTDAAPDDPGSTHAWAEVYLPGGGWIAFDPTHRRVGSAHLIPIAVGRANAQIMPITGGYAGDPADFIGMEVAVRVTPRG